MSGSGDGTCCALAGCPGLRNDGMCPNGYGVTCEAIFPEPTNMDEDPLAQAGRHQDSEAMKGNQE